MRRYRRVAVRSALSDPPDPRADRDWPARITGRVSFGGLAKDMAQETDCAATVVGGGPTSPDAARRTAGAIVRSRWSKVSRDLLELVHRPLNLLPARAMCICAACHLAKRNGRMQTGQTRHSANSITGCSNSDISQKRIVRPNRRHFALDFTVKQSMHGSHGRGA